MGFFQPGFEEDGEFAACAAYAPVPIAWPITGELCHVAEITPNCPGESPIGLLLTHAGIFSALDGGEMLAWFALPPPFTSAPWPFPDYNPRLDYPTAVTNALNASLYQREASEWSCEEGDQLGLIDGFPIIAGMRLTAHCGHIVPGGLSREERSRQQIEKLRVRREERAAGRAAFLERTSMLRPQLRSHATHNTQEHTDV